MIAQTTLDFLEALKANNNKPWFDDNRPTYQKARTNFLAVVQQLINALGQVDPGIAAAGLEAKQCIMRINRDIRFSKDKTPYKTNLFAFFSQGGKKSAYAGYYFNLEPGAHFIGGGVYMPEAAVLNKIRQEIDYNWAEWQGIAQNATLLQHYPEGIKPSGQLSRPPKGYDKQNPALEYLKYKGYYTQHNLTDAHVLAGSFLQQATETYHAVRPLVAFINRSFD